MAVIDVHAHHIPDACVELAGPIPPTARDIGPLENRLDDMTAMGVDIQIVSAWMGFYSRDLKTAKIHNDGLAESVHKHPDRFLGLAIAPLAEPEAAPRELERAVKELGLRGVEIGTNVLGKNLDEKEFGAFFRKVEELNVPMFIHPVNPLGMERLRKYRLDNLVGNLADTAVALSSLIFGGVLQELPRLTIYVAHGGGACPYIRGRLDHAWKSEGGRLGSAIPEAPTEYLKRIYYDALVHSPQALEFLVDFVGADHVMLGSDYPFGMGDLDPVRNIESAGRLSRSEKEAILGGNAEAMFKL